MKVGAEFHERCTCEPGRASDGSEHGMCAYCEDADRNAEIEASNEAHARPPSGEDCEWPERIEACIADIKSGLCCPRVHGCEQNDGEFCLVRQAFGRAGLIPDPYEALDAEGGASGLAAGSHQPVAPQPREEHNSPETGDVEGLVERLRAEREAETWYTGGYRPVELVNPDGPEAADSLLSLSRLLQERTRERDEARGKLYVAERVEEVLIGNVGRLGGCCKCGGLHGGGPCSPPTAPAPPHKMMG